MKQINCQECYKPLSPNATRCTCGWRGKTAHPVVDHRCHYQSNDERCPLLGTICPHPYGNTPWYCRGHWSSRGNPKLGEEVLRDAQKNYQTILVPPRDWRSILLPKRQS